MRSTDPKTAVRRAFGAENRQRLIHDYLRTKGGFSPDNAWRHVYGLLLWIDRTTGLAHCYESDKSQPGRPWYERSLRFHAWAASEFATNPSGLSAEIDWLFQSASRDLVTGIAAGHVQRAAAQRAPYEGQGFPEPGTHPEIEHMILEALEPWFESLPTRDVLHKLAERIHEHTRLENKRKNLVGEGFEDVLAALVARLPASQVRRILTRSHLHDVPGFFEPPTGEKPRKVDLALLLGQSERRVLLTVKWSIRADREEQFMSDFRTYARLERAGTPFDYSLITNEFDPARLVAACERQWESRPLFKDIVHVNPAGLLAAYGTNLRRSFVPAARHIEQGRVISLRRWLARLQTSH